MMELNLKESAEYLGISYRRMCHLSTKHFSGQKVFTKQDLNNGIKLYYAKKSLKATTPERAAFYISQQIAADLRGRSEQLRDPKYGEKWNKLGFALEKNAAKIKAYAA